jgi:hypothetical protein
MLAASVKSAAVLTVRPRPVLIANKSNDRLSGSLILFRHRRRNLSREARIERIFQRMTDVTAEIIARGCAGDPAAAVREAREKLTSSASCECGFDVELLRLFAKGYRSSGPAMAVLRALAAAAAATWVATNAVLAP